MYSVQAGNNYAAHHPATESESMKESQASNKTDSGLLALHNSVSLIIIGISQPSILCIKARWWFSSWSPGFLHHRAVLDRDTRTQSLLGGHLQPAKVVTSERRARTAVLTDLKSREGLAVLQCCSAAACVADSNSISKPAGQHSPQSRPWHQS